MASRARQAARNRRLRMAGEKTLSEWLPLRLNDMAARGCRPRSLTTHENIVSLFIRHAGDVQASEVTPEVVEAWQRELAERLKPSTVNGYVLGIGSFFNYLVDEGVLEESPTLSVELYRDDAAAPKVLDMETFGRILAGARMRCQGRSDFEAIRDEALLALFLDTGIRASECAGCLLENLDLSARQLYIHAEVSKGGYSARTVTFGHNAARLLGRYLREREAHKYAWAPQLFVGKQGTIGYYAIYEVVKTAARRGGVVGNVRPHLLRHTWTHLLKQQGLSDEIIMALGGWSTDAMLRRYGRAERTSRAIEAYKASGSPMDRATATADRRGVASMQSRRRAV